MPKATGVEVRSHGERPIDPEMSSTCMQRRAGGLNARVLSWLPSSSRLQPSVRGRETDSSASLER